MGTWILTTQWDKRYLVRLRSYLSAEFMDWILTPAYRHLTNNWKLEQYGSTKHHTFTSLVCHDISFPHLESHMFVRMCYNCYLRVSDLAKQQQQQQQQQQQHNNNNNNNITTMTTSPPPPTTTIIITTSRRWQHQQQHNNNNNNITTTTTIITTTRHFASAH